LRFVCQISSMMRGLAVFVLQALPLSAAASGLGSMTLVSRTHEYDGVSTWHFKPDKETPFGAGMSLHLVAPGVNVKEGVEKKDVRHMSFASAPKEGVFSFAMDVPSSPSSFKKAMDGMQPGDKTSFFKVKYNDLAPQWAPDDNKVVFLAGGIGITPFRSLIKQHGHEIDWRLVHVARDEKHLFSKELQSLGDVVLTDRAGSAAALRRTLAEKKDSWFYVCGSDRFMTGMLELLEEAGVPKDWIKAESFH